MLTPPKRTFYDTANIVKLRISPTELSILIKFVENEKKLLEDISLRGVWSAQLGSAIREVEALYTKLVNTTYRAQE